ncbi:MAG: hypothetical protein QG583_57, partial [Patescibacteria group bacterium]|nr:hypothetical protein [Patescibacteria group bacterium]
TEAEKSSNEPEVLKLENEIRDLENIQNPKQKITEEKIEQSKTPPPIPKPREKVEYQSLFIYNNLSRKEYFDFKNLKPKNVSPEYAKEYQEKLSIKENAYRESKNKIVTALVMEGRQQEAQEFLMHEVEIKRKNDIENGGLGPKIKQGISNGIEAWDKWGVEHTDKEGNLVKGNVLKRLAKMGVSMTLIGLTASWSVEKLANIGGTATALDGGTTSYLLNKLKIGLGLGAIMETIPPKHKKWVGKLVTMTVIAGGATLAIAGGGLMAGMAVGASSAVGYGLSKLAQGRFSEKKIDERAEKMKTDNTINVENIEEDSAEFERQAEEAIIKAENTRLKRKLAGATAALVGSVATLEFSGMIRDHQNELAESENIKNQEINTVEESTVERYVTVGNGDGVTQALSELNKGGAVPSWFSAELGPNPTPSELAQFAKDIDTYRPDSPEDSLVLHKGDSIGFKNDCLVLGRGGETFILAKPDGSGGFTQGDWQEQMTNEKFMDTIDTMQEKEAHENQLVSDLNSQTEQAPSTSPMIDDNTMPYEPITTKPIAPMNASENTNTDENKINTNDKDSKDETTKESEKIVQKTSNNGDYKAKVDYTAKGSYSLGDRQQNIPVDKPENNSNNYDDKNYEPGKYEGHLYYKLNPGEVLAMQKMEAHNMRELLSTEESMDLWNKIKDSHTTTNAATIIAMDRDSIGDPNMLKLHDHFVDIKEETGVNPFDGKKYLSPQEFFDKGHQNAADHHILRKIKL